MILGIYNWAEIISAVTCTICLIYKPSALNRWFVLFLWVTTVVELIGKLLGWKEMYNEKLLMYNLFNGVEFFFYLSLLLVMSETRRVKNVISLSLIVFGFFFLLNLFFVQGLYKYNEDTHTLGAILIIFLCLMSLYEIFVSETEQISFYKWPFFIIVSGLLIYYTGNVFHVAMKSYLDENNPVLSSSIYKLINHNLNLVLYSFFSTAFVLEIVRKGETKKI